MFKPTIKTSWSTRWHPQAFVDVPRNIYSGSSFQVKTAAGLTTPIQCGKGIIQGWPWSILVFEFEQGIDHWLRWIEQPYPPASILNPVQGFVDDVCISSTSDAEIAEAVRKTGQVMDTTGVEVKHRKCAIMHGKRSVNRWSKNDTTGDTCLSIQDQPLPMYHREQAYSPPTPPPIKLQTIIRWLIPNLTCAFQI
ncbi:hypothetical protein ACOMHN_006930 [Nucella lapillus]